MAATRTGRKKVAAAPGRVRNSSSPAPGTTAVAALKGVLVAVDFAPASEKAFRFAVSLLQNQREVQLYLIHAVGAHVLPGSEMSPDSLLLNMQIQDEHVKEAKSAMRQKVAFAKAHKIPKVKGLVVVSDPVHAIIDTAKQMKADLILLGNRRRGYRRGIIFGSVSERVAADSPTSVLIVR